MDKKVKIYTTPRCGYCQQAKEFLTERGIDYEAFDVSADRAALDEMKKISGGSRSVPVISVCGTVLVGFDRAQLEEALKCIE